MLAWDEALKGFQQVSANQLSALSERHVNEIEELRVYLE